MEEFMATVGPYLPTAGVFVLTYAALSHFEELLGLRGIVKVLVVIIITVLFYHFGDDVGRKFTEFMHFLGLGAYEEGSYGTGK